LLGQFWIEVDEQCWSAELRAGLAERGLRAGRLGNRVPVSLAALMRLPDQTAAPEELGAPVDVREIATVRRQIVQNLPGERCEIVAGDAHDALSLFDRLEGDLSGRLYPQAQGMLGLTMSPEGDGRVRVEMVPELHYGDPRQKVVPGDGLWRYEFARPRRSFDEIKLTALLAPGETIAIGADVLEPRGLGRPLFTRDVDDHREHELLLIRAAHGGPDDLFARVPLARLAPRDPPDNARGDASSLPAAETGLEVEIPDAASLNASQLP
jgi:hypothetical protein